MNSHGKNPRTARFVSTTLINLLIVVVAWAWTDTARAVAPVLGWGDKILHLRNLPPDLKESVHQQLHFHTAIGFHYHHCFVFGESCDLWTWGGGFVLYNDERYWQFDDDDLQRLLGKELYGSLSVPWTYRVPPALPVFAVIVVCIWLISSAKPAHSRLPTRSRAMRDTNKRAGTVRRKSAGRSRGKFQRAPRGN